MRARVFKIKKRKKGKKAAGGRGARLKRDTTGEPEAGEYPSENKQTASRSRSLCVHGILIIPRPGLGELPSLGFFITYIFLSSLVSSIAGPIDEIDVHDNQRIPRTFLSRLLKFSNVTFNFRCRIISRINYIICYIIIQIYYNYITLSPQKISFIQKYIEKCILSV